MFKNQQQGIALVISLVMLVLMTLIGLFAMRTSIMEEKMAGNSRDQELAFQAAETGLRDAEDWIETQSTEPAPDSTGSSRVWTLNSMDPDTTNAVNWWQERGESWWHQHGVQDAKPISGVSTEPYTIIEYLQFVPDTLNKGSGNSNSGITYYRITSRGTGGSDQARVLLQSTVARRY